jgi:hypothetical protein
MSEQVKRPLYIVGDVDLGTKAVDVDATLEGILKVASAWKAIVLIDEVSPFCFVSPNCTDANPRPTYSLNGVHFTTIWNVMP